MYVHIQYSLILHKYTTTKQNFKINSIIKKHVLYNIYVYVSIRNIYFVKTEIKLIVNILGYNVIDTFFYKPMKDMY